MVKAPYAEEISISWINALLFFFYLEVEVEVEMSRAESDLINRSGPIMKKEIIGLGLGLDVGFFLEKSLGLRKMFKAWKPF